MNIGFTSTHFETAYGLIIIGLIYTKLCLVIQKRLEPDPALTVFGVKAVMINLSNNKHMFCDIVATNTDFVKLETEKPTSPINFAERCDETFTLRKKLILIEERGEYSLFDMATLYKLSIRYQ